MGPGLLEGASLSEVHAEVATNATSLFTMFQSQDGIGNVLQPAAGAGGGAAAGVGGAVGGLAVGGRAGTLLHFSPKPSIWAFSVTETTQRTSIPHKSAHINPKVEECKALVGGGGGGFGYGRWRPGTDPGPATAVRSTGSTGSAGSLKRSGPGLPARGGMGARGAKPSALYPRAPDLPQKSYLSDSRGHGASTAHPAPDLRLLYRYPVGFMEAQRAAPRPRDRLAPPNRDPAPPSRLAPHQLTQPLLVVVARHRAAGSAHGAGEGGGGGGGHLLHGGAPGHGGLGTGASEAGPGTWAECKEGAAAAGGAGVGAWWEPPVLWEEAELALEPWRVAGRGEVMAMAASLQAIAAASRQALDAAGGGGGEDEEAGGGIDTPTLTLCFCELLRQAGPSTPPPPLGLLT